MQSCFVSLAALLNSDLVASKALFRARECGTLHKFVLKLFLALAKKALIRKFQK